MHTESKEALRGEAGEHCKRKLASATSSHALRNKLNSQAEVISGGSLVINFSADSKVVNDFLK